MCGVCGVSTAMGCGGKEACTVSKGGGCIVSLLWYDFLLLAGGPERDATMHAVVADATGAAWVLATLATLHTLV